MTCHNREKCPKRVYPETPLVGVGVLVCAGGKFLLIRRANEPGRGLWSIPGGLIEVGEKIRDAARREVEEETGMKVEIGRLIDVLENIIFDEEGLINRNVWLQAFYYELLIGKWRSALYNLLIRSLNTSESSSGLISLTLL
ncbi:MAG: NUDIX domain-containing protein [Candidatus Bathyarchaeia archaeon]